MVVFIESIQAETLRAQNTGKSDGLILEDGGGSLSSVAALAGLEMVHFSKNLPESIESKKNYSLTTDEAFRKMTPLTIRNHIDAHRDARELLSLFDRVLPLPWAAGAWAVAKARPVHRWRRRHYLHRHDAHH